MKLDDKRKVIEVLLCSGRLTAPNIWAAGVWTHGKPSARLAIRLQRIAWAQRRGSMYHEAANEAAYRLIESSPTLRREWFGRP